MSFQASIQNYSLLPEAASLPLEAVRLQIPTSPFSVSQGLKLLRDLIQALDPAVQFTVCVKPGTDVAGFRELLERWGQSRERVKFVEILCRNLFAQDNALVGRLKTGEQAWLLPRPRHSEEEVENTAAQKLAQALGIRVDNSQLHWEGGNVLCDGHSCLLGVNSFAKTLVQENWSFDQTLDAYCEEFGQTITLLGDLDQAIAEQRASAQAEPGRLSIEGSQADFHIDLDLCLLGTINSMDKPRIALADALPSAAALQEVCEREELFTEHFLPVDEMRDIFKMNLEATAQRRKPYLESYRSELESLGYEIISMPDVRLASDLNYHGRVNLAFNYVNVIPAADAKGDPRVFLFRYGFEELDNQADKIYRGAGIEPVFVASPVTANELQTLKGGLHCLYSKLA